MRRVLLAAILASPAAAAELPPRAGRTDAQYEWSLAELRDLHERASARTARFLRADGSGSDPAKLFFRLLAGELDYAPVYGADGALRRLVLPDARELAVTEKDVRAHLGGRRPGALVSALGLRASADTAEVLGRTLAVHDLALLRLSARLCPGGGEGTGCLRRAAAELRARGEFSVPVMDDEESVEGKGAMAPALSREYVEWQLSRRPAGPGGEADVFLRGFVARAMERLWRKASSRMGPHHPWIYGSTMAEVLRKAYPSATGGGRAVFFPAGRAPLAAGPEAEAAVKSARAPWEALAAGLERGAADGLAPLSPYAAEELAEMGAVIAAETLKAAAGPSKADVEKAAAVWEGEFGPVPASSAPAAGPWFAEVPAERSGIALPFPEAPRHSWEAPGEMPGGLAVLDFDLDGLPDLFFCDFDQVQLYRNRGGMRFELATSSAGLAGASCANGASSADYDADGRPDLLLLHDKSKRDRLLRNLGGRFADATREAGLSTAAHHSTTAVWLDFDRDGRLDLFVAEAGDYRQQVEDVGELLTGGRDRLYRGLGNGRFADVTARAGLGDRGWGLAAVALDYDGDGWPDLDVVNDFGVNRLYRNRRDGTFAEVSREAGVDSLGNGMGVSAGDFDRDGRIDLFVTYPGADRPATRYLFPEAARAFRLPFNGYFSGGSRYPQRNRLFRNLGDGTFRDEYLERVDDVPTGWGWNGMFLDADNRGWQDLFQLAGWWPDQFAYSDQTMVFWRWDPASGRFRDASAESGLDFAGDARASIAADLDGDGCLDVVVTGFSAPRLFAGRCSRSNHWLSVRLEGADGNRDGLGARITVRAGGAEQTAEMGGQGGGFQNSLPREARFGLGAAPRADSVEVVWPRGRRQLLEGVEADRVVVIREERR